MTWREKQAWAAEVNEGRQVPIVGEEGRPILWASLRGASVNAKKELVVSIRFEVPLSKPMGLITKVNISLSKATFGIVKKEITALQVTMDVDRSSMLIRN